MKSLFILALLSLALVSMNSQDTCLPLWPRLEFGNTFSDFSSSEKIFIKFNTRSECPKSYVTVADLSGNIRKTYCESTLIQTSEKMANYKTFVQRCSVS